MTAPELEPRRTSSQQLPRDATSVSGRGATALWGTTAGCGGDRAGAAGPAAARLIGTVGMDGGAATFAVPPVPSRHTATPKTTTAAASAACSGESRESRAANR